MTAALTRDQAITALLENVELVYTARYPEHRDLDAGQTIDNLALDGFVLAKKPTEPAPETIDEWWLLGHPGWPDGIDFPTREKAEQHYWGSPKLDGTREGIRIVRKAITRYADYVPQPRIAP